MKKARGILILILYYAGAFALMAGNGGGGAIQLLRAIDSRCADLDSLIFGGDAIMPGRLARFAGVSREHDADRAYDMAIDARTEAEIGEFMSRTGVQLTGQTYWRADAAMGIDEEDPVSAYNGKVQVEARWYPLQSSIFKRAGNIRALRLQADIDRALHEKKRLDNTYYSDKEALRRSADSLLSGVIQHRIANLQLLSDANLYLLGHRDIPSDELLGILDAKAKAERALATLTPMANPAATLRGVAATVTRLDTAALMRHIAATSLDMKILGLRLEQLQQQADNTSWWEDCRVAPFVRYSRYFRDYGGASSNIDVGVSFTVPVNSTAAKRRRVIAARQEALMAENGDILSITADKVAWYAGELERLNRASEGEVARMAELREYLGMRAEAYANALGEYNRLARLKEYNNYIESLETLIGLQYRRDCILADLQSLLTDGSVTDFTTNHPLIQ